MLDRSAEGLLRQPRSAESRSHVVRKTSTGVPLRVLQGGIGADASLHGSKPLAKDAPHVRREV